MFIGTIIIAAGLTACIAPAAATTGDVTADELQFDADTLANGSVTHTQTVLVEFSETADFGSDSDSSEIQFHLRKEIDGFELEDVELVEDIGGETRFGDIGAVTFDEGVNRSGSSVTVKITLRGKQSVAEDADFYRNRSTIKVIADENKPRILNSEGTIVDDPSLNNTTTLPVSVTPGTPATIATTLGETVLANTDRTAVTTTVEDAHGNSVPNTSVDVALIGDTGTWETTTTTTATGTATVTIGEGGTMVAPIGDLTAQVTLPANGTLGAQHSLTVYPATATLQTSQSVINATGTDTIDLMVDLGVPPSAIDQYSIELGYTSQQARGNLTLQGPTFRTTLTGSGATATDHGRTAACRTYSVAVDAAGNYTIEADIVPTIDGGTKSTRVLAKTTFVNASTQVARPLVGTVRGGTLEFTVRDPHSQRGPVHAPQQRLRGLTIGDTYRDLTQPVESTDRQYTTTVDVTRWNVSPTAVGTMTAVFGEHRSTVSLPSPTGVHERYQLSGSGWHRLSTPLPVTALEYRGITRTADGQPLLVGWNGTKQQYERLTTQSMTGQLHRGWYVYVPDDTQTAQVGMTFRTTPAANRTATLGDGWQLVGANYNLSRQRTVTTSTDLAGIEADRLTVADDTAARGPLDTYWVYNETPIGERSLRTGGYDAAARTQVLETTTTTAATTTTADSPPGSPAYYTGILTIDGQPAIEQTVTVRTNETEKTVRTDDNGTYTVALDSTTDEAMTVQATNTEPTSHPLQAGTTYADINLQSQDTDGGGGYTGPPPLPAPSDPTDQPPLLDIAVPTSVAVNTSHEFSVIPEPPSSDVTYRWTVGDDTYAGHTVEHTFTEPGAYAIEVTATNAAGKENTTATTVTIPAGTNVTVGQSSDQPSTFPWLVVLAGIGVVGLCAVAVGWTLRRK